MLECYIELRQEMGHFSRYVLSACCFSVSGSAVRLEGPAF
jgi:hypothetical protein